MVDTAAVAAAVSVSMLGSRKVDSDDSEDVGDDEALLLLWFCMFEPIGIKDVDDSVNDVADSRPRWSSENECACCCRCEL